MEGYISGSGSKIISFPLEEYVKTYKTEPEGFEMIYVVAQALGCFCFCIAVSEIFKGIEIKPSLKSPECEFSYLLCDFEKNCIEKLSIVQKNKLLVSKNYQIYFEKNNLVSGNVFLNVRKSDENTIKLKIKVDFDKIIIFPLEMIDFLFKLIWEKLSPELSKAQKPGTMKTLCYVPEYLKFSTAPFIQELRKLMTAEKNKMFFGENTIIAEKITKSGNYIFSYRDEEKINSQIISQLKKMNDLTVDVLNGVIHILLNKSRNNNLEAVFSIDDLLFIRGKKPSKNKKGLRGGYKDSQRSEILEHLYLLANLKINISDAFIPNIDDFGKRTYSSYAGESPLIYLEKQENQKRDNLFYVRAGEVLAMSMRGKAAKIGLIHKKIAEYDYYRYSWEKRIGNYLAWLWRSRQYKADFLVPIGIESLLFQIGEENKLKRPYFIRNRMENALCKLESDGVIKNWQYKNINESFLIGKNWLETWINLKLVIEPPLEIIEEYSRIKNIENKIENNFDFQEILLIIKEKNLSQINISEDIEIKGEVLAGILSGKVLPNTFEKRKLKNWVKKQKG